MLYFGEPAEYLMAHITEPTNFVARQLCIFLVFAHSQRIVQICQESPLGNTLLSCQQATPELKLSSQLELTNTKP